MKGFLEAISKLKGLDWSIFCTILFRNERGTRTLISVYNKPFPNWIEAFNNAPDFETGRSEALDCIIGDYTVLGEI
jgi:hypothetical protein